jgi:hypothetical protein
MLDRPPIKMAVLSKPNNVWVASESADDQEAGQFITCIEDRIGARFSDISKRDELPDSHLRLSCAANTRRNPQTPLASSPNPIL